MYCKKCGSEIADDAVFCSKCGAMQGTAAQQAQPQTGQPMPVYSGQQRKSKKGCLTAIIVIAVAVLLVFFLGDWLFGDLFGDDAQDASGYEDPYAQDGVYQSVDLDLDVREHYTRLKGNGEDVATVMVYMIGSDLESDGGCATADLIEMINAEVGGNVNLIVQTGGAKSWQNDVVDARAVQRWQVVGEGLRELDNIGRASMVDPGTVTDFVRFCAENYPADRYGLIFWNHGGGTVWGYGSDEYYSGSLSLAQIDDALTDADVKFDFVGFDACLMATIENAVMLEKHADYLIASEELEPGQGWDYAAWLPALVENSSLDTISLGSRIVDSFIEHNGESDTLSVVELREIPHTYEMLSRFIDTAKGEITAETLSFSQVSQARSRAKSYYDNQAEMVDIVDLVSRLDVEGTEDVVAAINSAVKYRNICTLRGSNGLSMYFPYTELDSYSDTREDVYTIGFDDDYLSFFDYFVNVLAGGQMSFSGRRAVGADSAADYSADDWYDASVANAHEAEYEDNAVVKEVVEKNGGYVLQMSDAEWDKVTSIGLSALLQTEEGYVDLGIDDMWEFDEDGDLRIEFDNTWVALNGEIVPFYTEESYDADSDDENAEWYNYGTVPAVLRNDKYEDADIELVLRWDNAHTSGYVAGYRFLEESSGPVGKGLRSLSEGDVVAFVCDRYDAQLNYLGSFVYTDGLTVTKMEDIVVSYEDLGAGTTDVSFVLTDLYQNEVSTETVSFTY